MKVTVRRLEPRDDRSKFQSGNIDLDRFFVRYAGQNQFRHHIGTTYVAIDDAAAIVAYATASASELTVARLPEARRKRLPGYPLPVLRLARLAVDQRAQGQGVGQVLMRATFGLAHRMADDVGCVGVLVDAKPQAIGFYEMFGFVHLDASGALGDRPEPVMMFIELGAIPAADS